MNPTSKTELARLLGDSQLGEEAYFLNILSRWDSLRILDYLFMEGPSSTGDIARGVNMDMREVRETLNALAEVGVVDTHRQSDETVFWEPLAENLHIEIESNDGLRINHVIDSSYSDNLGFFTKLGKWIDSLFRSV